VIGSDSSWSAITSSTPYTARYAYGFVVLQSALSTAYSQIMYVFGGVISGGATNSIEKSTDGAVTWSSGGAAPWSARYRFAYATLEDASRVLIAGGRTDVRTANQAINEVWVSSQDMTSWIQRSEPPWTARSDATLTNCNDNFYLVGGQSQSGTAFNDVV